MKTYARIQAGTVVELFRTEADIASLFHKDLQWVEVQSPPVEPGWVQGANGLAAPPPAHAASPPAPTLAELQARLAELAAQVAALAPH